jgi:hypothetical protein
VDDLDDPHDNQMVGRQDEQKSGDDQMEKGACTQVGQRRQVIGNEQGEVVLGGQSAGNIGATFLQ